MSRTRKLTRPRLPMCSCGSRHAPDSLACVSVALDGETFAYGHAIASNDNRGRK